MREFLIEILGGYTKDQILTEAVKDLYNTISKDDILQEGSRGEWLVADRPIIEGEKKLLISEAQIFIHSRLWKVLQTDIKYQSNKKMFEDSKTEYDLIAGKMTLYLLDIIKTRLESLNKERGIFNSK